MCLQCVELDFQYPSEGIHRRWDAGFRITACAATPDQSAFVLSVPRRRPMDETQVCTRLFCTCLLSWLILQVDNCHNSADEDDLSFQVS